MYFLFGLAFITSPLCYFVLFYLCFSNFIFLSFDLFYTTLNNHTLTLTSTSSFRLLLLPSPSFPSLLHSLTILTLTHKILTLTHTTVSSFPFLSFLPSLSLLSTPSPILPLCKSSEVLDHTAFASNSLKSRRLEALKYILL